MKFKELIFSNRHGCLMYPEITVNHRVAIYENEIGKKCLIQRGSEEPITLTDKDEYVNLTFFNSAETLSENLLKIYTETESGIIDIQNVHTTREIKINPSSDRM